MRHERIYDYRDPASRMPRFFWYKSRGTQIKNYAFMCCGYGVGLRASTVHAAVIALLCAAFVPLLASCADPVAPPEPDADPYAEFYAVATPPAWPVTHLEGVWTSAEYTLRPDSVIRHNPPERTAWLAEYRTDGRELWCGTPGGEFRFRGAVSVSLTGHYIQKSVNGRYGPVHPITFERVQ